MFGRRYPPDRPGISMLSGVVPSLRGKPQGGSRHAGSGHAHNTATTHTKRWVRHTNASFGLIQPNLACLYLLQ
jgi:hypothetical protein